MSTQEELDAFVPGTQLSANGGVLALEEGFYYYSELTKDDQMTRTLFRCLGTTKRQLFLQGRFMGDVYIVQNILVLANDWKLVSPRNMQAGWSGLTVKTLADPARRIVPVQPDELPQYMNLENKYPEWDTLLREGTWRLCPATNSGPGVQQAV